MTGATIRAALNARLTKTEALDAINTEITLALQAIARRALWPDLHKTDSTTLAFTLALTHKALPADYGTLDRLYLLGVRQLEEEQADVIRACQEVPSPALGIPSKYCIIGGDVYLLALPSPAVTVYVDYWAIPALITDETAALVLGDEFLEAVICGTIVAYFKHTGFTKHPKLAEFQDLFDREIALLLSGADHKVTITKPFRYGQ